MRTTAAFSRHTMLALLEALLLAALVGGILASAAVLKPGIGSTGAGSAAAANPNRSGDSHIWLMPQNPAYEPIPCDDAAILGRVVTVLRRL